MKPIFAILAFMLVSHFAIGQKDKDIPSWGKIDKAELEMKECDFDKDAEAMVLVDKGVVDYQKGNRYEFAMRIERRIRIKILKESGFDEADIKIYFYSDDNYEKFTNVDAVTYNLDPTGKIIETKVDKKSFFRQKEDRSFSTMKFTFPEVKVGSVLEYRYSITREYPYNISPWKFQTNIPTKVSLYAISFPEYFRFIPSATAGPDLELKKDNTSSSISLGRETVNYQTNNYYYKLKNIPALKGEPYMGSLRDYEQRIEFQLSEVQYPQQAPIDVRNTWPRLVTSLMEASYFGDQIKRNLSKGDELEKQLSALKTPKEKIVSIFRYVQKAMTWSGEFWYGSENAKEAWSKRSGSTGDINMILLNLLKDEGIDAYPLIASTRSHGKVYSAYPLVSQFNTLVILAQIDETAFVLDASDKFNSPAMIPFNVLGTEAFLVDQEKAQFITLWDNKSIYKHIISIAGSISDNDLLQGSANVNSYDYARIPRAKKYTEGKERFTSSYLTGELTNIKVDELELKNLNNDSLQLEQKFKFSVPINGSGEYKYFTLNLFTGLEKNPFVVEKRISTIDFGYTQNYMMVGSIGIPEDHQFEELPKNMMIIMPDTSIVFRRVMEVNNNRLNYRITIDFKRSAYGAEEYEEFRDFYKKLFANLNEQIVYKKKSAPKP